MSWNVTRSAEPPDSWRRLAAERGSFYHDPRWTAGLAAFFRFPLHCLTAVRGAEVGALALAEVPGLVGRPRLVSLPFSYAAGPVMDQPDACDPLYAAARELVGKRGARRLEIKSASPCDPLPRGYTRLTPYAAYLVSTDGADAVWGALHQNTRRSIQKAERDGVETRVAAGAHDWLRMAQLQEDTAAGHGLPPPPRRFFAEFCAWLEREGMATLYLATVPNAPRPVAGIVLWKGRREWIYAFGAWDARYRAHRPTHALLWHALRDATEARVTFDLGRAAPEQRGLVQFKEWWGGHPRPLAYDYWPAPGGLNTMPRDRGLLAAAARVWSALPTGLTRRASWLYRYLG
jgi:hypothetical protein